MSDNQSSTLKSYVDSATGAVQNAIGSITGNTTDQSNGQRKQNKADAEYDTSHATVKGPGLAVSGSGAVTKDDPDRSTGKWNQTIGSAKEATGGLIGSEGLKQTGREQNLQGQQQEARGQMSDLGSGVRDRLTGTVGGTAAGLTGDRQKQMEYQDMRDQGKTMQRGVEHDIQKESEAQQQANAQ